MTPNHALFRRMFEVSQKTAKTFDYLPDAGEAYPFVYIGENNGTETPASDLLGELGQTVHLYGKRTDRRNLDAMSAVLLDGIKKISDGHGYHFYFSRFNQQIIPDNTDVQPLLHIVLDFTFRFTQKGN